MVFNILTFRHLTHVLLTIPSFANEFTHRYDHEVGDI